MINHIDKLLLCLPFALLIGLPIYIYFREKMSKKIKTCEGKSKKRVIKLTTINLALNSVATIYFFTIFILVVAKINFNGTIIEPLLAIIFMLTVGVTYYGNGIYITSIILEDYTLPDLRKVNSFNTQFIATHLFHGPISHILVYAGWMLIFLALALLDLSGKPNFELSTQIFLMLSGIFVGILYGIAQIYNGTSPYQFWVGMFSFIVITFKSQSIALPLSYFPVGIFFIFTTISYICTLAIYFIRTWLLGEHINWDRSGY